MLHKHREACALSLAFSVYTNPHRTNALMKPTESVVKVFIPTSFRIALMIPAQPLIIS